MDNNRTILAVVLIVLLWSGYSLFFTPQTPVQQVVVEKETLDVQIMPDVAAIESVAATTSSDIVVNTDSEESFLTVSSSYYDIKISSIGATVRTIVLKKYRETKKDAKDAHKHSHDC